MVVPQAMHANVLEVCRTAEAATMASLRQLVRRHAGATVSTTDPRVEHMSVLTPSPSSSSSPSCLKLFCGGLCEAKRTETTKRLFLLLKR